MRWLALCLVPAGALLAQNSAPDPVIKVSVDLVQMDAIVTDSQGHHVAGLKPEDFRILEDGKPQQITTSSYSSQAGQRSIAKDDEKQPSRTSSGAPTVRFKAVDRASVR